MRDEADAQASIVLQGLDQQQTDAAFDMLKFYFAVTEQVVSWHVDGKGEWKWLDGTLALVDPETGQGSVINAPPGFGPVS